MECEEAEVMEYCKKHKVDIIENIDELDLLIYLKTFIELKVKAVE